MNWRDRAALRRTQGTATPRYETPFLDEAHHPAPVSHNPFADDRSGYQRGYTNAGYSNPVGRRQPVARAQNTLPLLNELRTSTVPAISAQYGDHRRLAMQLADTVLSVFGLRLPPINWTAGDDAHALGQQITIGNRLAQSLSLPALTQLLLHEAGHVHEGHANIATGLILRSLVETGHLSPQMYNAMMRDEERVADVYAAIGAWMFDPHERPGMANWLLSLGHPQTDTHPSSRERAAMIQAIVRALDSAVYNGLFDAAPDPWAFGD